MVILVSPIIFISVCLYLLLILLGNHDWVWLLGIVSGATLSWISIRTLRLPRLNFILTLLILIFIGVKAWVISPLILTKTTNAFNHLQITGVGDYYKHSFVVTVLNLDGVPPNNPYFPSVKLSYYFGYYLIPASISHLFNIGSNLSLYFFVILTDILALLILVEIITQEIKSMKIQVLTLLLIFTGFGIDIWSVFLTKIHLISPFLGDVLTSERVGLQLINNYTSFIYVPQHFFAAALSIGLTYQLLKNKINLFNLTFGSVFISLSSVFVALTYGFWLLLIFIFRRDKRWLLVKSALISTILILPFLLYLLDRSNLLYLYLLTPYEITSSLIINYGLMFLLKYGLLLILIPVVLVFRDKNFLKSNLLYILGLGLPWLVTWFIRSPIYNDFSLRTLMPLQLIMPVFWINLISKSGFKQWFLGLSILVMSVGMISLSNDYLKYWRSRQILPPKISELLYQIRTLPSGTRLASVDRDRWVELTPSLGYKKILSPYLFDSYVYFVGPVSISHGQYERLSLDLFVEETVAQDLDDLVNQKNSQLEKLTTFFGSYSADWLVLPNQLWVKKDTNPWLEIFKQLGVRSKNLTNDFTMIDYLDLNQKLAQHSIKIDLTKPHQEAVIDQSLKVESGLWLIASCSSSHKPTHLKLEFEDYNLLFNKDVDGVNKSCSGKVFYLPKTENLRLTNLSTIQSATLFPLIIK